MPNILIRTVPPSKYPLIQPLPIMFRVTKRLNIRFYFKFTVLFRQDGTEVLGDDCSYGGGSVVSEVVEVVEVT